MATLDRIDSSPDVLPQNKGVHVSRLMLARINRVGNDQVEENDKPAADPAVPTVKYFGARAEEDPLPEPSLLEPIDS